MIKKWIVRIVREEMAAERARQREEDAKALCAMVERRSDTPETRRSQIHPVPDLD